MNSKLLDKFYTKDSVARNCWSILKTYTNSRTIIEPSAGSGRLLDVLDVDYLAFDLYPERSDITKLDFLSDDIHLSPTTLYAVFGNPPFGKRSNLAVAFLNKSLELTDIVGMILPIQFKKWGTQVQINRRATLISETILDPNSFTLDGKDYSVRCVFQIWTTRDSDINLRICKPITSHPDFRMYQYNATKSSVKYFGYDWDICVLRQGWDDFNVIFTKDNESDISRKKQWMFIKANNIEVLDRIKSMDFNMLACQNTSTKGFGKADLVREYDRLWPDVSDIFTII